MILPVKVPITTTSAREKTAGHISRNDSKIKAFAGISATSETGASAPQPDGSNFATNIAQEWVRASEKSQYDGLSGD